MAHQRAGLRISATFTRRRNFTAQAVHCYWAAPEYPPPTAKNLAIVNDESIIVLTRMESHGIMRSLTKVGGRVAMVASGVGKAVFATCVRRRCQRDHLPSRKYRF